MIEKQGKKQVETLELFKLKTQILTIKETLAKNTLTEKSKIELNKIKK